MVLRQVIGLWFSLENSPSFGISEVFPPLNQRGMSWSSSASAWKDFVIPLWRQFTLFHQKLTMQSGPGALQLRFFKIVLSNCLTQSSKASSLGSDSFSPNASLTSWSHSDTTLPIPSVCHNIVQKAVVSATSVNIYSLLSTSCCPWSYLGLSTPSWLSMIFLKFE